MVKNNLTDLNMYNLLLSKLKKLGKRPFYSCGFTEVTLTDTKKGITISVNHGGNMGNSIERDVNPNLKLMGFPTIEQLKRVGKQSNEQGSPDYSYTFTTLINNSN